MQTLERFDNHLLAIHRVALADKLHINGTRLLTVAGESENIVNVW